MEPIEISKNIYWVGVNDRQSDLFEGLWPIRENGVSINSYLILDEKKVLIDLSNDLLSQSYIRMVENLVPLKDLDYIILNHLEPDHTGALQAIRRLAPKAVFLGTAKAKSIVSNFYGLDQEFQAVADGETLNIGAHTLKFTAIPFVHWPETMVTYDMQDQILFSCDAFGGYGALPGIVFDDECTDLPLMERESLRYYSNIVAAHSRNTRAAIEKLSGTPVKMIAPSHGLIWRKNPGRILELYTRWSSYPEGGREKAVTLAFASMYGNTRMYAESVAQAIAAQGLPVEVFDVNTIHVSYVLASMWKNQGVIVCAPTYETALFPVMANVLNMAKIKKIMDRTSAYFGSYAWGSLATKQYAEFCAEQHWDVVENMQFYGMPKESQFALIPAFAEKFAAAVRAKA